MHGISVPPSGNITLVEAKRNHFCDYLHQMIEGLKTCIQTPLQSLEVSTQLLQMPRRNDSDIKAQQIEHFRALTNPFRRLRARTVRVYVVIGYQHIILRENWDLNEPIQDFCKEITNVPSSIISNLAITKYRNLTVLIS